MLNALHKTKKKMQKQKQNKKKKQMKRPPPLRPPPSALLISLLSSAALPAVSLRLLGAIGKTNFVMGVDSLFVVIYSRC